MEYSLFEKGNMIRQEQAFGICLGRIVSVNTEDRVCSVATFSGAGSMEDKYIERCQWLSPDVNPEGDEAGSIPRKGSIGLVFTVNYQSFIWGFLRPLYKGGTAAKGDEPSTIVEGDKILSTIKGNRITVKRSGLIELYSSGTLQRLMVPNTGAIWDICKTYTLNCSAGGRIDWISDPVTSNSLYRAEFTSNKARPFLVTTEIGHVTSAVLHKLEAGPAIPFSRNIQTPSFTQTIGVDGTYTTSVTPPIVPGTPVGCKSVVSPTGAYSFKGGTAQQTSVDIDPAGAVDIQVNKLGNLNVSESGKILAKGPIGSLEITEAGEITAANKIASIKASPEGEVSLLNKIASIKASPEGEISLANKMTKLIISSDGAVTLQAPLSTVTIKPTGEVTIDSSTQVAITAKTALNITSMGTVNIEANGPASIKSKAGVTIDGGSGVLESVLTNPSTISPFTGAPLMPFSTTVKVST